MTWECLGMERHWIEIKETKIGKAFAKNQQISECFVEASLQALTSQLWSIHWTLCWSSDPQVKEMWMRKERVNDKCNWSETQGTLKCPRWNASARWVSLACLPRAGCRPKSHFYQKSWCIPKYFWSHRLRIKLQHFGQECFSKLVSSRVPFLLPPYCPWNMVNIHVEQHG